MMKLLFYFFAVFFMFSSCKKKVCNDATVIKDCTGSYLRVDKKDYLICNENIFSNYANGTKVQATFIKLESCKALEDKTVCMMVHEHEGLIEVKKIQ
ncbi:MAG: hypothetical protein SFY56_02460 [Bacteroidota bacterium]|nr:hypothetical protein [Bacteroidota bacterium]